VFLSIVTMAELIAFDSKEFNRGRIRPFYTPVGAGVVINKEAGKSQFETSTLELKSKIGMKRGTNCVTYRDVATHLGRADSAEPIKQLLESMDGPISEIHYYFVLTRLSDVKIYGRDMPSEVTKESFLEILCPSFVLSSAWKYIDQHPAAKPDQLILDNFSSEVTGGAEQVFARKPEVRIRGDECHYAVNLADLATGFFDLEFDARHWRVNETDPRELFPEASFKVTFNAITTEDFHAVTPIERRRLPVSAYVKHPVVFFINESRPDELKDVPMDQIFDKFLYKNPVWHKVLNLAYDLDGSAKLLEPREDLNLIEDGDVLIHAGSSGKKVAEYFHGYCPHASVLRAKDLFDDEKMKKIKDEKTNLEH